MFKIGNFLIGLVKSIVIPTKEKITLDKALSIGFVTIEAFKKDGTLSVKNAIKKADYLAQNGLTPQGIRESPTHLITFVSENEGWRSFERKKVQSAKFTSARLEKKYEIVVK